MTLDKEEVEEEEDVEEKEDDDAEEEVEDHQGRRREEGEVSLETRTKTITWKRTRPSVGTSFVLRCRAWLLNKQGPAGQRLVLGQWAFYADSEHKAH